MRRAAQDLIQRLARGPSCRSLALAVLCAAAGTAHAQDGYQYPSKVAVAWNQLNDYDQVSKIAHDLAAAYPELLKIESIGKSVEGREMWLLTLNNTKTGPDSSKPAMYIDGNIHGNEVQASEVVLYSIWYLTKSYGKVESLTKLVDRTAFYFLPMVNPDGRAYWFSAPNTMHSSRSGKKPVDNDGDGLFDEDPPNDLDGDGQILQMRREDPNGRFRESPEDPRIMIPVEPQSLGEFKRYTLLGEEGIDDDGDGRINEDGPGGYDPNRNWPADWLPNSIQFGAGDYPLSLPESQAIASFILSHTNIAAVQAYHNNGGMILRGPGAQYVEYPQADIRVYDRIGRRGEKILPFYKYMVIWSDLYIVHGGFINWTYDDLGIISFTNELWNERQYYSDKPQPATDKEELEFNDFVMFGQTFVPWKKFKHPTYGDIELGGWVKMTGRVPPSFHLEELCHRNFAFTMYHAEQMPLLEIAGVETTSLGGGLTRVRADVRNSRSVPTVTGQGAARHYGPRDFVEIAGAGLTVVAGGTIRDRFTAPFEFVEYQPQRLWVDDGVPGDGFRTFQWLVRGSGRATIRYASPRAASAEMSLEIR
ncbi:MAG: M14 family metallopeptidase [Phycisphaerae bacterium]